MLTHNSATTATLTNHASESMTPHSRDAFGGLYMYMVSREGVDTHRILNTKPTIVMHLLAQTAATTTRLARLDCKSHQMSGVVVLICIRCICMMCEVITMFLRRCSMDISYA